MELKEQLSALKEQLVEILSYYSNEEFEKIYPAMVEALAGELSKNSLAVIDDMLRVGDEQGYTLDRYLQELSMIRDAFESIVNEIREQNATQPNKLAFCDAFLQQIDAFMLVAVDRVTNREVFNVAVELCHPDAKMPSYAHEGDQGADIYAVEDMVIEPHTYGNMVPTGLKLAIPHGWAIAIRPRSGLSAKSPLRISNAPGTIDNHYRGEVKVLFDNFSDETVEIKKGARIAQMILEKNYRANFNQVEHVDADTERGTGGFGSSGN